VTRLGKLVHKILDTIAAYALGQNSHSAGGRRHRHAAVNAAVLVWLACKPNPDFDGQGADTADAEQPAIEVHNLRSSWTTPNQIRWAWELQGTADDLFAFELVTGPSAQDVHERTETTQLWTEVENPELGRFLLLHTGGVEPVTSTVTDLHEPDREVYAELTAIDTTGRRSVTNVASARTTPPAVAETVIFSEDEMPGYSLPATFLSSDEAPYMGLRHYQYVSSCDCWMNLRRQDLAIELSGISEGQYRSTAFLELALALDGVTPSWWNSLWLWYDDANGPRVVYSGWTVRAGGEYRLLQVPLRALLLADVPDPLPLDAPGQRLHGINIGGRWAAGMTVRVDEIRIRW